MIYFLNSKFYFAKIIAFIFFTISSNLKLYPQFKSKPIFDINEDFSSPDINPNMNIFGLSQKKQINLFEKLNSIDQKYRLLLINCEKKGSKEDCTKYWKLISKNDKALQIVFDKMLIEYGWPSNTLIESDKIWFIIWHATEHGVKRKEFYIPIIQEAYRIKYLHKKFYNNIIAQFK